MVQVVFPVSLLPVNQPAEQVTQEDDPDAAEKRPAGHVEQVVEADAEYQPAEQAVQDGDIVATAEY